MQLGLLCDASDAVPCRLSPTGVFLFFLVPSEAHRFRSSQLRRALSLSFRLPREGLIRANDTTGMALSVHPGLGLIVGQLEGNNMGGFRLTGSVVELAGAG
jgi:hypothetical protein